MGKLSTSLISSIERLPLTTGGAPLVIRGKDFRVIRLIIPRERDCHDVFITIKRLGAVVSAIFSHFIHQFSFHSLSPVPHFSLKVCDTYPTVLCVPATATKSMMLASARFRSRGRFPVLTYLHPNGTSALCRSSQPLAGFSSRCLEDQMLFETIRLANSNSSLLYVVDTRPPLNALTNRAQGKGYEDVTVYRNIAIQFFDIENIHVVRSSLDKLLKVVQEPAISLEAFTSGLEKSGWLRHLRVILEAAFFVATRLNEGNSVLVHCSDGWDRTAQVCSLAQIILDPYCRTFTGFEALIKKEWLSFGHKFSDRCSLTSSSDPREASPIFTQFLDCVRHLCTFCPVEFEFSCDLLCLLHDAAYAATYGTFVGCSEKERRDLRLTENTFSVWPLIAHRRNELRNPFYKLRAHSPLSDCDSMLYEDAPAEMFVPNGIELSSTGETPNGNRDPVDMLPTFVLSPQLFQEEGMVLLFKVAHLRSLPPILPVQSIHQRSCDPTNQLWLLNSPTNTHVHQQIAGDSAYTSSVSLAACLPQPSVDQLAVELTSVATSWTTLARRDIPCSNCGILLALCDRAVHCHRCGTAVCSRCVTQKPRCLPGLWSVHPSAFCLCVRCSSDPVFSKARHFTQLRRSVKSDLIPHPLHPNGDSM
ncbi:myotubularin-related protein 6/7/8 [Paragonimus westermani]|uniref:Myotubularin-related protein 6/7/8 n=1 Tax=Paragonimus westermani TaxID=34504 RepID=A0A5J4NVQ9_9TREM|nr:myotubularin-related protein 6/7/8 [Paragonimus westermani]